MNLHCFKSIKRLSMSLKQGDTCKITQNQIDIKQWNCNSNNEPPCTYLIPYWRRTFSPKKKRKPLRFRTSFETSSVIITYCYCLLLFLGGFNLCVCVFFSLHRIASFCLELFKPQTTIDNGTQFPHLSFPKTKIIS